MPRLMAAAVLTGGLLAALPAQAYDTSKFPDWSGQWDRIGGGSFDPSKRPGRAQQPPLQSGAPVTPIKAQREFSRLLIS